MPLRSVHEKRMTQIDRARIAQGQFLRPLRRAGETICGKLAKGQASFACGCELPCDISMRAHADAGRRIIDTNI